MPDDTSTNARTAPRGVSSYLTYSGRLARPGYWAGMLVALLVLVVAFFAFVHASTPTATGDTAPLVFVLLPLFFWVHSLVTVKRLRDAGMPAWHYVFYVIGPIAWLALAGQASQSLGPAILVAGFVAILCLPGLYKSKPDTAEAPPAA